MMEVNLERGTWIIGDKEYYIVKADAPLYKVAIWLHENIEGEWIKCNSKYIGLTLKSDVILFKLGFKDD